MSGYKVKHLAEYMKKAREMGKPFVLFTGAGCSKSAGIPLACELVEEINQRHELDLIELSESDRKNYGRCMSALTKDDRRELLKGYIQNAKINWAHIVQALLLEKGYIQRVLTFNFDNILSRSCGLLGLYPSIYDFTSANLDLLNLIIDPAIVHLHGQSHGFVQLNTDAETTQHADQLSQFVASTLNQFPSIFIGYSGQADAFFPLLKDKFSDQQRLFWIGREEKVPEHVRKNLVEPNNVAHYLHHADADLFFIELAQELECFPPKAFDDPFGHLLNELEPVLDFPTKEDEKVDVLTSTRSILKKAQADMEKNKRPNFELLLMEGKYEESIACAKKVKLEEEEKTFVAWAETMLGNKLAAQAQQTQQPELLELSFAKYKEALAIKPNMHDALNNWGNALSRLAILQQKSELFEQSIEKYQAALAIKPDKHETLNNWGNALLGLAQLQQNSELFEQSIERYQAALAIKPDMYQAIHSWGNALLGLARLQQKPELFEQSIEKYQAALAIKPDKHETLNNWGNALLGLAQLQQNSELFEQSIERYQATLAIKPDKYEALHNWGSALFDLARLQKKPEFLEQSIEKFQAALAIKPDMHDALNNWGSALFDLAKLQKKPELLEQSIEKFQEALVIKPDKQAALNNCGSALCGLAKLQKRTELFEQGFEKYKAALAIQSDMYDALNNWGIALCDLAKLQKKPELFEKSIEKYQAALAIKPDMHDALNNWGIALCDLAKLQKKPELFEKSIEKYQAALAIKPDMYDALNNWGSVIFNLAQLQAKPELLEQSIEKFKAALAIKPDMCDALNNWGAALLSLAEFRQQPDLLEEAKLILLRAKSASHLPNYNLACLYSLQNDEMLCKAELMACKKANLLPEKTHIDSDKDLDFIRDKAWFKEFMSE